MRSGSRSTRAACGSIELEATLERLESEGQLERVKLIYTIPEHANPTGISLAATRRRPLVELARKWSKKHRIFVLEDAAYRGLGVRGPASRRRSGASIREAETVILARTFSKTLSPGLKIGYGVLPEALVEPILCLEGKPRFRLGELQPAAAGADPGRRKLRSPRVAA